MYAWSRGLLHRAKLDNNDALKNWAETFEKSIVQTIEEGKKAQATYEEFSEFCEEKSKEMNHEIKTAEAAAEDLEATDRKSVV